MDAKLGRLGDPAGLCAGADGEDTRAQLSCACVTSLPPVTPNPCQTDSILWVGAGQRTVQTMWQ